MPLAFYAADTIMLLAAVGAAVAAFRDSQRIFRRWRLLLPGFLAVVSTASLVAFPHVRDLLQVERVTLGAVALLVGALRGAVMGMSSDQIHGLVRQRNGRDSASVASAHVLLAAIQFGIDVRAASELRIETTIELIMIVTSGYLIGRALAAWFRAGSVHHDDLVEP